VTRLTPRRKGPPIVLLWQRLLPQCRDIPIESPPRYAVVGVGAVLVSHCDPDGRHCRPAIGTIEREVGVSERTVVLALAWLVEHGWLEVTRKVARRPTEYRLTIPVTALEQLPLAALEQVPDNPVPAVVPAVVPALEQYDLRTSERSEEEDEEEEKSAWRPSGAYVASTPVPPEVKAICTEVARLVGVSLDASRLAPAMTAALARTKWNGGTMTGYCVDKLKTAKWHHASAFLAADLQGLTSDTVPSPRMKLAGVLAELEVANRPYVNHDGDPNVESNTPWDRFERLLVQVGLIEEDEACPKWWQAPEGKVQRIAALAHTAVVAIQNRESTTNDTADS
jgi:Helix-turn-helix domain